MATLSTGVIIDHACKLSIDPGIHTGWAAWSHWNELVGCGIGEPPINWDILFVVVEKPRIYPRSPVPPNDIITLAFGAGKWAGKAEATGASVKTIEPHAWKGNEPKSICHARIDAALNVLERAVVKESSRDIPKPRQHDMLDAIGIGLVAFRGVRL